jgi:23S rRNA (adenine2503-C2)-methyltransferase
MASMQRLNLWGLDRTALSEALAQWSAPSFRSAQVYRWLYARRTFDAALWTDLPRELRERLAGETTVEPGRLGERVRAADGTVKYRVELSRGGAVEAVYMRQPGATGERETLCISSQVGCALGCDFCLTARMGFVRHLDAGEIAGQVALIQHEHGLFGRPFHVVFMGMGEPLHNFDEVVAALRLLVDPDGFGLSRRRITVSTSGLAPAIERLAAEPIRPRLAVSLNASDDAVRDRLMPINRKYPIARLVAACRHWYERTRERFTFEYVLLAGVNDSDADVGRLIKIARGVPCKINVIPFNAVPGRLPYEPPAVARVEAFRAALVRGGVPASVRFSRGAEARAACGQLALEAAAAR